MEDLWASIIRSIFFTKLEYDTTARKARAKGSEAMLTCFIEVWMIKGRYLSNRVRSTFLFFPLVS